METLRWVPASGGPTLPTLPWFSLVPGPGGAEEEVLEVADPELPELQQAAANALHGEQHGHSDLRAGQVQPQRAAVLGDAGPDVQQQRLVRLSLAALSRLSTPEEKRERPFVSLPLRTSWSFCP